MVKFSPPKVPYVEARHKGGKQTPTLIVLHSTVTTSAKGAALGVANWWNSSRSPQTSAHYVVDEATAYQCVFDHTIAFHCGYNTNSIGLEMCDMPDPKDAKRWDDKAHQGVMKNTAEIAADLCLAYGIRPRYLTDEELLKWGRSKTARNGGITTHAQMSRVFKRSSHWDPGAFQPINFLNMVKSEMVEKRAAKKGDKLAKIRIIGWNFWVNQPASDVRAEFHKMTKNQDPHVVCGYEGLKLYGKLDGLGYEIFQLKPKSLVKGRTSNNGNVVIGVRKDVPVLKSRAIHMKIPFRGPKTGHPQDPRVDRVVKVLVDGKKFKIRASHGPFGAKPKAEMVQSQRNFLRVSKIPTIIVEDANMKQSEIKDKIANPTGSKVAGQGIDVAVYKNCTLTKKKDLGNHGSDHPAMLYEFTA